MLRICRLIACMTIPIFLIPFISEGGNRDSMSDELKTRLQPALALSIEELQLALSIKVHAKFDQAHIVADDGESTFLGKITNPLANDSIFNEIGRHGSELASESIWNDIGRYGSKISKYSPFNEITSSPPYIVKNGQSIGRLTVNDYVPGAVDPNWLKSFYK